MALQPLVFISCSLSFSLAVLLSLNHPVLLISSVIYVQLKVFTIVLLPTQHARSLSCRPPDITFLCYSPKSIVLILAWIDCAISYCKRRRLHPAYIHLYPFHLSLPFPFSNSFRACWHTSAKTKSPTCSYAILVFQCHWNWNWQTFEVTAAHDRVTETQFYSELVVYQEL